MVKGNIMFEYIFHIYQKYCSGKNLGISFTSKVLEWVWSVEISEKKINTFFGKIVCFGNRNFWIVMQFSKKKSGDFAKSKNFGMFPEIFENF